MAFLTELPDGEEPLALKEAARKFRGDVSPSKLSNWIRLGVKATSRRQSPRVKLDATRIGGRIYTSAEAYMRFLRAINKEIG